MQALRANPALSRAEVHGLAELGRLNAQHIPVALRRHVRQRGAQGLPRVPDHDVRRRLAECRLATATPPLVAPSD